MSESAQKEAEDSKPDSDKKAKEEEEAAAKAKNDGKVAEVKVEGPSTAKLLEQIQLTAEQKAEIKKVYDTIVTVKFRWGGLGFIQVSESARSVPIFLPP